jgi:hypothetical protein
VKMLIVVVVSLFVVGCGSSVTGSSGAINMAGSWNFATSSVRGTTTGIGALSQTGSSVSGTLALSGACASTGPFAATLSGTSITAVLSENGQAVNLTGTVATSGSSASGNYTSAAGGCTNGDTGTWTATRTSTSASGSFVGSIKPADRNAVGVSIVLAENNGTLSGSATFTNSTCLRFVHVEGVASDSGFQLNGNSSNASVTLEVAVDPSGDQLAIKSNVTGSCAAESASGTLLKVR